MRYKIKNKINPVSGDVRIKTKFLIFPKKCGNEVRWLESATWKETYFYSFWYCGCHWGWKKEWI